MAKGTHSRGRQCELRCLAAAWIREQDERICKRRKESQKGGGSQRTLSSQPCLASLAGKARTRPTLDGGRHPSGNPIPRSKGRQSSAGSVILLPRPDRDKPREITDGAMNQSHNR